MAFIFKRKNSKNWYIGWYDPRTGEHGTPKSSKTADKKLAEKRARQWQDEVDLKYGGENRDLQDPEPAPLLSEAYQVYLKDKEYTGEALSDLTQRNYKTALGNLYRSVGDKKITKYTRDDYNAFVEALKVYDSKGKYVREMSQNSKAIYTKCVFALFAWLEKEKYIPENPMKRVAEEAMEFRIISESELKKIFKYTREKTKFSPLLEFLILSGFRIQEALNLKYSDIRGKTITVKGKGSKWDFIPVLPEMERYLSTLPKPEDKDELVFPGRYRAFHQYWRRMIKATGLRDDITPHDLRKYCLSKMANSGVPVNFVQRYARHSSIQTTMKYYIQADLDKMVDIIDSKVVLLEYVNSLG